MTTTQSPPDNAGVRFPPPFIDVAVFLVALLVQRLYPVTLLPQGIRRVVALFCLAAWLVISGSSIALFRRAHTSVMPVKPTTAIVTSGPYGWTRNSPIPQSSILRKPRPPLVRRSAAAARRSSADTH